MIGDNRNPGGRLTSAAVRSFPWPQDIRECIRLDRRPRIRNDRDCFDNRVDVVPYWGVFAQWTRRRVEIHSDLVESCAGARLPHVTCEYDDAPSPVRDQAVADVPARKSRVSEQSHFQCDREQAYHGRASAMLTT